MVTFQGKADSRDAWLLLVCRSHLGLALTTSELSGSFRVGDEVYDDLTVGQDFPVFYDRLRETSGKLVGFEVLPLVDRGVISTALRALHYVHVLGEGTAFQILITRPAERVERTTDQAFGGRVFKSTSGWLALTVPLYFLDPSDLQTIGQANLDWILVEAGG